MRRKTAPTSNSEAGAAGASASSAEPWVETTERKVRPWHYLIVVLVAAASVAFSVGVTSAGYATKDETRALDRRLIPVEEKAKEHERRIEKLEAMDKKLDDILHAVTRSTP